MIVHWISRGVGVVTDSTRMETVINLSLGGDEDYWAASQSRKGWEEKERRKRKEKSRVKESRTCLSVLLQHGRRRNRDKVQSGSWCMRLCPSGRGGGTLPNLHDVNKDHNKYQRICLKADFSCWVRVKEAIIHKGREKMNKKRWKKTKQDEKWFIL